MVWYQLIRHQNSHTRDRSGEHAERTRKEGEAEKTNRQDKTPSDKRIHSLRRDRETMNTQEAHYDRGELREGKGVARCIGDMTRLVKANRGNTSLEMEMENQSTIRFDQIRGCRKGASAVSDWLGGWVVDRTRNTRFWFQVWFWWV